MFERNCSKTAEMLSRASVPDDECPKAEADGNSLLAAKGFTE
ncbi:hypothetical protein [Brevibacillus invocatus]|nr:hypothetical protein [Brevibacillus invocatus]